MNNAVVLVLPISLINTSCQNTEKKSWITNSCLTIKVNKITLVTLLRWDWPKNHWGKLEAILSCHLSIKNRVMFIRNIILLIMPRVRNTSKNPGLDLWNRQSSNMFSPKSVLMLPRAQIWKVYKGDQWYIRLLVSPKFKYIVKMADKFQSSKFISARLPTPILNHSGQK